MLVLGRKTAETIIIDDDIVITVIRIEKGRVRLGIAAPKTIGIRRGELAEFTETNSPPQKQPSIAHKAPCVVG